MLESGCRGGTPARSQSWHFLVQGSAPITSAATVLAAAARRLGRSIEKGRALGRLFRLAKVVGSWTSRRRPRTWFVRTEGTKPGFAYSLSSRNVMTAMCGDCFGVHTLERRAK